jgi:hypothetical protein
VVEPGEAGDDARGLDAPYGFDGAMQGFFQLRWILVGAVGSFEPIRLQSFLRYTRVCEFFASRRA